MIHLDVQESVLFEVRRHPFRVYLNMFLVVVLAVLPLIVSIAVPNSIAEKFVFESNPMFFFVFCYSVWLLLLWTAYFFWWISHYAHAWIVTDSRIFDLTRHSNSGDILSYRLEDVEEVKVPHDARFVPIGNIELYTKTENGLSYKSVLLNVPYPRSIQEKIVAAQKNRRDKSATVIFETTT